ncbi:RICIN domain-containing protein [Streptomyces sp. AC627_RSS907]|uniref:RICIN domain-containing protein n=1 Tax=Streptomyces sp. AC627_RSS907 TaxID=2823684 RepID=UPI001C222EE8|nr:RICIN domain-containing protein [Streptomyces sp. AC627_RSS907]
MADDLDDELGPPAGRRPRGGVIRRLRAFGRQAPAPAGHQDEEREDELQMFQPFGSRDSLRPTPERDEERFGQDGNEHGRGGLKQWVGRHRTPVLAATALTVALSVAVPVLLAREGGDSDRVTAESSGGNDSTSDLLGDMPSALPDVSGRPSASGDGPSEDGRTGTKNDAAAGGDGPAGKERPAGDGADSHPTAGDDASGSGDEAESEADSRPPADDPDPYMIPVGRGQWEGASHVLAAEGTSRCLVRQDARAVGQGACGPDRWSRHGMGADTYLLKHIGANRCLDTDGSKLYLSDCTTADSGQVWRLTAADGCGVTILSVPFGTRVSAAGDTGVAASSSGTMWRAPSLFDGC